MHTDLPEDLCGTILMGVRELLFDPQDEPGPPMREAVALDMINRSLILKALTDTSELQIRIGTLKEESSPYRIRNASEDPAFKRFIGKHLRNWWIAQNDGGYTDCFLVAFTPFEGLCFIAMNNEVSVLKISGEQFA
jgi:uncharacterized protein DUF6334